MYSIVIPTFNRSRSLLRTLESVTNQTLSADKYEIIIVDDGSADDTGLRIISYKLHITSPIIRYFKSKHCGSAAAKNLGIKESKGEIIFFTDDDCIVPPNWMETLLDGYKRYPDVVGVGGWFKPPKDEKRFFQNTAYLINIVLNPSYLEEKLISGFMVPVAFASNVAYKKDILGEVGGFNENISAVASVELRNRIIFGYKKKMLAVPIFVTHHCDLNFFGYIKKIFRQGRCKQHSNYKSFKGRPPLNLDVSFWRAPLKLFKLFSQIFHQKEAKFADFPAIFVFLFLEVFFNACGGFYEKHINKIVDKQLV